MRIIFAILLTLNASLAWANEIEVDVELFLAVDVSRSMNPYELEIQRQGYASALSSDAVQSAIAGGLLGRIAVTYVEWAGAGSQKIVVPWTLIETKDDANSVARQITAYFDDAMRRTSISSALLYAADSIEQNNFIGLRRVIDVSGDGPNNMGIPVEDARDTVLARRIIINGIPLMTQDDFSERWGIEDLDVYYRNCVIGGPGAFVIPVLDWDRFAEAVRRKLVLEIAGRTPQVLRVNAEQTQPYNCLIGEQIWERYRSLFAEP
ncbi:MAG: DUF1194 domain-containing protein [Rhodobacteraceae bacterium]|nr:DUF1194 domain-containing protein [Paracoccaceae bacterium]